MTNKKILIMNPSVREIVREVLRAYKTIEGSNGIETLEEVPREEPGLILLDVMVPKKIGFEVIQELEADPETAGIPIVLLTARGDGGTLKQGQEAGMFAYLTKSFSSRKLVERVPKIMKPQETRRALTTSSL